MDRGSRWSRLWPDDDGSGGWDAEPMPRMGRMGAMGASLWRNLAGRSAEMAEVEDEVAAEQRGHVVIIGRSVDVNRGLLACLRQQPPVPAQIPVSREGFFTLIQINEAEEALSFGLPMPGGDGVEWDALGSGVSPGDLLEVAANSDLLLYLLADTDGWQPADAHWHARLRATGVPLLPVLVCQSSLPDRTERGGSLAEVLRRPLGVTPAVIRLRNGGEDGEDESAAPDVASLVDRMLALRPRLAISLAREIPGCRQTIAQRVIRSGALMTTLVGAEPAPLLDLPIHVALHWRVALQLAAIFGRPGLDYRSREMAGTVALNLCTRYAAQQALKLVPFVGWLLSAGLSGLSTWMLGNALLRYYENDQTLNLNLSLSDWPDRIRSHLPEAPWIRRRA